MDNNNQEGGISTMTIVIGSILALAVGIGGYLYFSKKKPAEVKDNVKGDTPVTDGATTTTTTTEASISKVVPEAATLSVFIKEGVSPVRQDYDAVYNYKKVDGIWYSAKKGTDTWVSWSPDSKFAKSNPNGWKLAVTKLDAKYPKG
jgi:hypothetical protein